MEPRAAGHARLHMYNFNSLERHGSDLTKERKRVMRGQLIALVITAALTATVTLARPITAANNARKVLKKCGGDEGLMASAPDSAWNTIESSAPLHVALRKSLGEPVLAGRSMINIYGSGGDLGTTEYSIMLVRGDDGIWKGTAVGQTTVWLQGASPMITPRKAWILNSRAGRKIDAILDSQCYYAEPTFFQHRLGPPSPGVLGVNLESNTPKHIRRVSYLGGDALGLTKELGDLSFPLNGWAAY